MRNPKGKGGSKMERSSGKRLLPLTRAQLNFASVLVEANARGAKFWFEFWGPLGNTAKAAVDATAEAQQDYLRDLKETLEEIEAQTSTSTR
jgi:hypothetical protein